MRIRVVEPHAIYGASTHLCSSQPKSTKMVTVKAELKRFEYEKGMHHFVIPESICKKFGLKAGMKSVRVLCHFPDGEKKHNALVRFAEGGGYVMINAAQRKKYNLNVGDWFEFKLETDASELGAPIAEALGEVFAMDEKAFEKFNALTDGKKRGVVYYVGSAKSVDVQIKRALRIAENLKKNITDLRQLVRGSDTAN